jgi:hypothetical protein
LDYRHHLDTSDPFSSASVDSQESALKISKAIVKDVQNIVKLWRTEDPSSCIIILTRKKFLAAMEFGIQYLYKRPAEVTTEKLDRVEVKRLLIHWKNISNPMEDEIGKTFTTCALLVLPPRVHYPRTHAILDDLGLLDTSIACLQDRNSVMRINSKLVNPKQFGPGLWQKMVRFAAGMPVLIFNHNDMSAAEVFIGNLIPTILAHPKGNQAPIPDLLNKCMKHAAGLYTSIITPYITPKQSDTPAEMSSLGIEQLSQSWLDKTKEKEEDTFKDEQEKMQKKGLWMDVPRSTTATQRERLAIDLFSEKEDRKTPAKKSLKSPDHVDETSSSKKASKEQEENSKITAVKSRSNTTVKEGSSHSSQTEGKKTVISTLEKDSEDSSTNEQDTLKRKVQNMTGGQNAANPSSQEKIKRPKKPSKQDQIEILSSEEQGSLSSIDGTTVTVQRSRLKKREDRISTQQEVHATYRSSRLQEKANEKMKRKVDMETKFASTGTPSYVQISKSPPKYRVSQFADIMAEESQNKASPEDEEEDRDDEEDDADQNRDEDDGSEEDDQDEDDEDEDKVDEEKEENYEQSSDVEQDDSRENNEDEGEDTQNAVQEGNIMAQDLKSQDSNDESFPDEQENM